MFALPFPEDVTVAQAIAFDQWSDDQKRIARAGIALSTEFERREAEARSEGFEAGRESAFSEVTDQARADAAERATKEQAEFADDMLVLLDRLQLFRQSIGTTDTRYPVLGKIVADFAERLEKSA